MTGERKSGAYNFPWRLCFTWRETNAHDVEIVDYHFMVSCPKKNSFTSNSIPFMEAGMNANRWAAKIAGVLVAVSLSATVWAQSPGMNTGAADLSAGNKWKFTGDIYLFAAGIGGESSSGGDIDVPFSDILKDLEMAFMGGLQARKGKWSLGADVIYMELSQSNDGQLGLPVGHEGLTVSTSSNLDLKAWIVTPTVGYNLIDTEKGTLDVIVGARYLSLNIDLDLTAVGPITTRKFQLSDSPHNWDGIVGVRGQLNLTPTWYLPYYADVGEGDSKATYQAFAGVGYRFKRVDAVVGYRYLAYEFEPNPAVRKLNFSGPIAGVKFAF